MKSCGPKIVGPRPDVGTTAMSSCSATHDNTSRGMLMYVPRMILSSVYDAGIAELPGGGMAPGRGRDAAAMQVYRMSLPAPAGLAERTLSRLRQQGAQGDIVESARLWQAISLLVGAHSRFGLRAEVAIDAARVEA
jgi:hypothetical protein